MMPNGGNMNPWMPHQWYNPAASIGSNQVQGMVDVNAFHMMASQQFPHQYGAGILPVGPVWNDMSSQSQWIQQWQSNFQTNWGNNFVHNAQPPPPPPPASTSVAPQIPPPPPQEKASEYLADSVMSEEEKNFDIQFKEWEGKFQAWKEENKNHPDKAALAVYEAQWKTWREQLIQNREKLRKTREESVAKQKQIMEQPKNCADDSVISHSALRQATQPSSNNDNNHEDIPYHFQPRMPNAPGQPLITSSQHNLYSNHAPNSSTNLRVAGNSSKLQIAPNYPNKGDSEHSLSGGRANQLSSGSLPSNRFDNSARQLHAEFRDHRVSHSAADLHSNRMSNQPPHPLLNNIDPAQKQFDLPLQRSGQHHPGLDFQDMRQRQFDVPPKLHNRDYHHEDIQHNQPMLPAIQRELNIPQGFQPPRRGILESPQSAANFLGPENNVDEDLRTFPSASSAETAANLFRKRAMRGKGDDGPRFAPYKTPDLPVHVNQRVETDLEGSARPRIQERLAEHAEIKLSALPQMSNLAGPLVRNHEIPVKKISVIMDPIVFEYNHRPGQRGRFAEPISIDSSCAKQPQIESSESKVISRKIEVVVPKPHTICPAAPKNVHVEKSPVKPVPLPLFPSAAAIKIQENPFPKLQPQILPDPNAEDKRPNGLVLPQQNVSGPSEMEIVPAEIEIVMVEDLLLPPGRYGRPSKIVVILRGLPGSGKSHLARSIKEKEVLMGGSTPRILSIDDYYLMDDGTSPVPWQEDQEEQYRQSLLKSLKKNLDDGHFSFIIVDALHIKASDILEVHNAARSRAFSVFLVDLPDDLKRTGTNRKCTEKDLEKMKSEWQLAPNEDLPRLDIRWLLQEVVEERIPTPDDVVTSTTVLIDDDSQGSPNQNPAVSKWETMEQTEEKLDRLDGIVKRKSEKPASMEDWLQSGLPDDYDDRKCIEGKKRVRWADVEEKIQQKKMRDLGFVVGQTNWSRMTDPTFGESALTKTKYI